MVEQMKKSAVMPIEERRGMYRFFATVYLLEHPGSTELEANQYAIAQLEEVIRSRQPEPIIRPGPGILIPDETLIEFMQRCQNSKLSDYDTYILGMTSRRYYPDPRD
jgi:hypothetical protein